MILISSSINFLGSVVFVLNEFKAHNLFTCESCTKWGCCRCVPEVFHIILLIVWLCDDFFFCDDVNLCKYMMLKNLLTFKLEDF